MWSYVILSLVCIFTWDVLESRAPKKGFVCQWLLWGKTWGRVHSGRREKLRRGWVTEMVTAGGPRAPSFWGGGEALRAVLLRGQQEALAFSAHPPLSEAFQHYCTLVAHVCVCVCVCGMGSCWTFRSQNGKGLGLALENRHCLHQVSQGKPSADHQCQDWTQRQGIRRERLGIWFKANWNIFVTACMFNHFIMSDSMQPPWTTACWAPLSMGFFWQEYWRRLLCPPPEDPLDLVPGSSPSGIRRGDGFGDQGTTAYLNVI